MKKLFKGKYEWGLFIKILSMLVVLVSVTFSWFVFAKDSWVNPFEVGVVGVVNVEVSNEGNEDSDWSNKVVYNPDEELGSFTEFSGNGERLYVPIVERQTITGFYLPDYSEREKDFIEIDTYFKTNGAIKLFLDSASSISPYDENNPKDYIAGAVRVAFLVEDHLPIIWAPNPNYEFKDGEIIKDGNVESSYQYVYEETGKEFIDTSEENFVTIPTNGKSAGVSEDKRFMWGNPKDIENYYESVNPIFKTSKPREGEEVIVKVTIRVWVEGYDREANKELIGGKIRMNLKFTAENNGSGGAN